MLALNVSEARTIADLFVILSGCGECQVLSIADAIMEKAQAAVGSRTGSRTTTPDAGCSSTWDVVVAHAFVPEERDLYRLERLRRDAPAVLLIA